MLHEIKWNEILELPADGINQQNIDELQRCVKIYWIKIDCLRCMYNRVKIALEKTGKKEKGKLRTYREEGDSHTILHYRKMSSPESH